jgi:hypothetical protein
MRPSSRRHSQPRRSTDGGRSNSCTHTTSRTPLSTAAGIDRLISLSPLACMADSALRLRRASQASLIAVSARRGGRGRSLDTIGR